MIRFYKSRTGSNFQINLMRFKLNKLKKAFDLGNSILIDKEFMKKSYFKVYFMLLALNKSVLINFEKMFSLSRSQKD